MNDPDITSEMILHPPVYTTSYEYDSNGNIEKIISDKTFLNKEYLYRSNVKDKLTEIREFQDIEDIEDFYTSYNVNYHNLNTLYITNYKNNTFTYENEKVIQHVSNGRVFYYTYDEFGRRIKKANYMGIGTEYIYNNDLLITEINRDYRFDFLYDSNGKLYGFIKDNTDTYYYVRDYLNNIIAITTKNGEIVVQYTYSAYGQNLGVTGRLASTIGYQNPFRYKGYYYDVETGLFWLSSRYYSPELCRFISPDDVDYLDPESINGLNLYAYCQNDPINYYDPTGHFMISTAVLIGAIIGAVVGAGVGFGIAAYNDYKDDGQIFNGSVAWYDYLGATLLGGTIGAVVGGAIGYGIGYLAGGTYSNGLVAKSVTKGVKSFMSNTNNIKHVLGKAKHNLSGYTAKSMGKLMKKTLAKGTYEAYKTVNSMVLASTNSQVTYVIINGVIKIGDMWIKSGG